MGALRRAGRVPGRPDAVCRRGADDLFALLAQPERDSGLDEVLGCQSRRPMRAAAGWAEYRAAVQAQAGPSGLTVFLELDLGSVIDRDPDATGFRALRIIAGNPVTMESMTRTTPGVGAFAPVTILLFEAVDGVHLRYDTVASALGREITPAVAVIAGQLDLAVLALIAGASTGKDPD